MIKEVEVPKVEIITKEEEKVEVVKEVPVEKIVVKEEMKIDEKPVITEIEATQPT